MDTSIRTNNVKSHLSPLTCLVDSWSCTSRMIFVYKLLLLIIFLQKRLYLKTTMFLDVLSKFLFKTLKNGYM